MSILDRKKRKRPSHRILVFIVLGFWTICSCSQSNPVDPQGARQVDVQVARLPKRPEFESEADALRWYYRLLVGDRAQVTKYRRWSDYPRVDDSYVKGDYRGMPDDDWFDRYLEQVSDEWEWSDTPGALPLWCVIRIESADAMEAEYAKYSTGHVRRMRWRLDNDKVPSTIETVDGKILAVKQSPPDSLLQLPTLGKDFDVLLTSDYGKGGTRRAYYYYVPDHEVVCYGHGSVWKSYPESFAAVFDRVSPRTWASMRSKSENGVVRDRDEQYLRTSADFKFRVRKQ